ncbi:helix-turn-helix domain-containing protein [Peptacetobacter sp.]|uniref:helix-turn-helix domain-containing protein n=1 Tax=Peptacetobacter sp. TaxID=2991975 RepID=UPI003AB862D3
MKSIGERVKMIRKELGLNQTDFAKGLDLSRSRIGYIENGERSLTERTLNDIVREYGVNRDYILTGEGDMFINIEESEEIINSVKSLCENDQEKAKLVIETYKMFLDLDIEDKKLINAMVKSLVEKKHPEE